MIAKTPARVRAEKLAAYAPAGAKIEITEDNLTAVDITQVLITGSIDKILVTVSNGRRSKRTRLAACWWFNSGGKTKDLKVRDVGYRIRNLYIDRRDHQPVREGTP